jgi:hypothetical protein
MQRSSVYLQYSASQRHSGWNQKSQIWTHQTKGQVSTSLMFIACVSWPKQVSCVCYLNSVKHLFGLPSEVQLTQMNLSSAAEVTLGLPFLWRSLWEFDHSAWWFLRLHLKKLKVKEMFHIDWLSCLKVMMDCNFSLLIWAVLAIIWTWSFTKQGYLLYTTATLSQHNWLPQSY